MQEKHLRGLNEECQVCSCDKLSFGEHMLIQYNHLFDNHPAQRPPYQAQTIILGKNLQYITTFYRDLPIGPMLYACAVKPLFMTNLHKYLHSGLMLCFYRRFL